MRTLNILMSEAGAELLKNFRAPEFIIPTLAMPAAFYTLFAVILPNGGGTAAAKILATFGVFAVMGPAIFGFGAGVASEREQGWLQIKRASPAPATTYVAAKLIATLFFSLLALTLMYLVARYFGGVRLDRVTWATLLGVHLAAAAPFVFIGLTFGFLFKANAAVAFSNIVFLLLSALGGLWIPIAIFPNVMQGFARYLPSYHLAEIALSVVNGPAPVIPRDHLIISAIMTAILAGIALVAWVRQR
ncbi:MAG: ABC transporter permease [Pseudomonadota bacterium]